MGGKTSAAAKNRYNAKAYDRITLLVPKGSKEQIWVCIYTTISHTVPTAESHGAGIAVFGVPTCAEQETVYLILFSARTV